MTMDPEFGVRMGDYFEGFCRRSRGTMGLTLEQIRAWQPPHAARGTRAKGGMNGRFNRRTPCTSKV